jgi:hypothetical protein
MTVHAGEKFQLEKIETLVQCFAGSLTTVSRRHRSTAGRPASGSGEGCSHA